MHLVPTPVCRLRCGGRVDCRGAVPSSFWVAEGLQRRSAPMRHLLATLVFVAALIVPIVPAATVVAATGTQRYIVVLRDKLVQL